MTYQQDELGTAIPFELYEFVFGAQTWRFTDSDAQRVFQGNTFTAEPISRSNLQQSDEDGSMTVEITVDALNPLADFFRTPYLPGRPIGVTIYRQHEASAEFATLFQGVVVSCSFQDATAKLTCAPIRYAIGRRVPIQLAQSLCTNVLYDQRCKVDPDAFRVDRSITDISGLTITLSAPTGQPAGYFDGGFINNGTQDTPTTIRTDPGDGTLVLLYNPAWSIGDDIAIFPGCDKKATTCVNKFANALHYQGFPIFPVKDPFKDEIQ